MLGVFVGFLKYFLLFQVVVFGQLVLHCRVLEFGYGVKSINNIGANFLLYC